MSSGQIIDIFPLPGNRFNCIEVEERKMERFDIVKVFVRVSWPPPVLSGHGSSLQSCNARKHDQ
jgi:hypothetical protein